MKTLNFDTIEFFDPNIKIELTIDEDNFLNRIGMRKNNLGFYNFVSHITDKHIDVQVFITFNANVLTIQIVTIGSISVMNKMSKIIHINPRNTNLLGDFVSEKFGKATRISRIFSKINGPFYILKWKHKNISIIHKFQDSHDGLKESLTFTVSKK